MMVIQGKYVLRIFEPFVQSAVRAQTKRKNKGKERDGDFKGKWFDIIVDDMIPCDPYAPATSPRPVLFSAFIFKRFQWIGNQIHWIGPEPKATPQ